LQLALHLLHPQPHRSLTTAFLVVFGGEGPVAGQTAEAAMSQQLCLLRDKAQPTRNEPVCMQLRILLCNQA